MELHTKTSHAGRRRVRRGLAGTLTLLVAVGGMQLGASAAFADDDSGAQQSLPAVTVTNGGRTEVVSHEDKIEYQVQVTVPGGVAVSEGATTVVRLPSDIVVTAYDQAASGAMLTQPVYDVAERTFTVTWKAMGSGALNSFPFTAVPAPSATSASSFVVSATTIGSTGEGPPFELTGESAPIQANGGFDLVLAQPGDWGLPSVLAMGLNQGQGNSSSGRLTKTSAANGGSFSDMRWRVRFDAPGATLPHGTVTHMQTRDSSHGMLLEDSETQRLYAHGPVNYAGVDSEQLLFGFRVPAGMAPGVYQAPVELLDRRADGEEVVVATTTLQLTVREPAATTISVGAYTTRSEVMAGEQLRFQFLGTFSSSSQLKDIRYVLPVPEGTAPETFSSGRSGGLSAVKVEYTMDGAAWETLPGGRNTWNFTKVAQREDITEIRVTGRNAAVEYGAQRHTLTLRADKDLSAGDMIVPSVTSVSFFDPVVGGEVTQKVNTARSVRVVSEHTATPILASVNAIGNGATNGFGKAYYNGQRIRQDLRLGAGSAAPIADPYMFAIVPRGMSVAGVNGSGPENDWSGVLATVPQGVQLNSGLHRSYASALGEPTHADAIGSTVLSDGSTLYYWKASNFDLTGYVHSSLGGMEMLMSDLNFSLVAMRQGEHTVQIGMGSAVRNGFDASSRDNSGFIRTSLGAPSESLGAYAGLGDEVKLALRDIGVTTDQVMAKTLGFTVPGSDSIAVDTVIRGSEDAKPITGNGIATTKLGAATDYTINVKNTGTYAYDNFQFIDVFPYAGDTYTLRAGGRGSLYDLSVAGRPVVKLNGKEVDALVQVSKSTTPPRFDSAGNAVASPDTWESIAAGTDGAKAMRVTLGSGVKFAPQDTMSVDFVATVPLAAPRDGSVANNSVAYRLERPGFTAGLETNAGGVRVPAAATDLELSGTMLDGYGKGLNGGVELQLFKLVGGAPVDTGARSTPAASGADRGVWGFVGIDEHGTYLVKPVPTNGNFTIDTGQLDARGFLKYVYRGESSNAANGGSDLSTFDGRTEFRLGDTAGDVTIWVKDLVLRVQATTDISGDLVFVDNEGRIVPSAGDYVKNWRIGVKDASQTNDFDVTTDAAGRFTFTKLNLMMDRHRLTFSDPKQRGLVFPAEQQPEGFREGTWDVDLVPGTGIDGLRVRVTDDRAPVIAAQPALDAAWNPTRVTVAATDAETQVTGFTWTVTGPDGFSQAGTSKVGSFALPAFGADGSYALSVRAVDLAGNLSEAQAVPFAVDQTAPALAAANNPVISSQAEPKATPTTQAGWIALFGVTATDAGSGLDPDFGAAGIGVDAREVSPGAGTFSVTFTARDRAGNTASVLDTTYRVEFVGVPTISVATETASFEVRASGEAMPANGFAALSRKEVIALFGAAGAPAHPTAPIVDMAIGGYEAVEWGVPGRYALSFQGTDSLGTLTETKPVELIVQDTIAPELNLGVAAVTFAKGDEHIPITDTAAWVKVFDASASDSGAGLADPAITVDASTVDYTRAGTYEVRFTATDVAGNTRVTSGRYTVKFAGDPAIVLGISDPIAHELGEQALASSSKEWIALFKAEATTAAGTTLKSITADGGAVNWDREGSYRVGFTATDSNDNGATGFGVVNVADTTAPVVTLAERERTHAMTAPATPWTGAEWAAFFGAAAEDGTGTGVNEASWTMTGQVNWGVAASYEVQLTVSDRATDANKSAPVTATITIQAPPRGGTETTRVPQNDGFVVDPIGLSQSSGTLNTLTAGDLSAPSAGGRAALQGEQVLYTPASGFAGEETLEVTVTDDLGQTGLVRYVFTVVEAPRLEPGSTLSFATVVDRPVTIEGASQLPAVRGENLALAGVDAPTEFAGDLTVDGDDIRFNTDDAGWSGVQQFTFKVQDDVGQTADIPVTLEVLAQSLELSVHQGYATETEVEVRLANLVPHAGYRLELHSVPIALASVRADAMGSATVSVTVPKGAGVGEHEIVLMNGDGVKRAAASFTVLDPSIGGDHVGHGRADGGAGALSLSGGDPAVVAGAVSIGLALLVLAALVVLAARRRAASRNCE